VAVRTRHHHRTDRSRRPERNRSSAARGRTDAARPRLQRRRERVGRRTPHLARSRRTCGGGNDRNRVCRSDSPPGPSIASVSRSLQEVVDALARAGVLVDASDTRTNSLPAITGLTADARRLERGMLFCAVRGAALDGHQFVAAAAARGAAAALVEIKQPVGIPQVLVGNGRRAAAIAAEAWYHRPAAQLQMIGVTGTNGKTTSVILARHVLSALWPMGAIGTLGAFDPAGAAVESEAGN